MQVRGGKWRGAGSLTRLHRAERFIAATRDEMEQAPGNQRSGELGALPHWKGPSPARGHRRKGTVTLLVALLALNR